MQGAFGEVRRQEEEDRLYCAFRVELKWGGEHVLLEKGVRTECQVEVEVFHSLKVDGLECTAPGRQYSSAKEIQHLSEHTALVISFCLVSEGEAKLKTGPWLETLSRLTPAGEEF